MPKKLFQAFLIQNGNAPWSTDCSQASALAAIPIENFNLQHGKDERHEFGVYLLGLRKQFASYLEAENPIMAANSILWAIDSASKLLYRLIEAGINEVTQNRGAQHILSMQ